MTYRIILFFALLFVFNSNAQVGIGTTNPNGALDITATNDGLLIPRVALSATNVATVVTPTISELVYNTATAGVAPNNVTPGFYYWDGSVWVKIRGGNGNDWSLNGNLGTTAGTNFIGTTDVVDLRFRTNNTDRWNISNANNGQLQSYNLGTATAPTYSWQGDTNTGVFSSGADNLNITTNGTERVRVAANGNVGIGTTNPSKELHVGGNTSTIRVDGLNATNNTNNLGGTLTTPVHVNSSGDLVVSDTGKRFVGSISTDYALADYPSYDNIIASNEVIDVLNEYNTTTGRYVPLTSGSYQITYDFDLKGYTSKTTDVDITIGLWNYTSGSWVSRKITRHKDSNYDAAAPVGRQESFSFLSINNLIAGNSYGFRIYADYNDSVTENAVLAYQSSGGTGSTSAASIFTIEKVK